MVKCSAAFTQSIILLQEERAELFDATRVGQYTDTI